MITLLSIICGGAAAWLISTEQYGVACIVVALWIVCLWIYE